MKVLIRWSLREPIIGYMTAMARTTGKMAGHECCVSKIFSSTISDHEKVETIAKVETF